MLKINRKSKLPIYQQIYEQIKNDILSGNIPEGSRITSTRALANELQVGRNSVENAYTQLVLEGYITSIRGSGYLANKLELDLYTDSIQEKSQVKRTSSNQLDKQSTAKYSFQYGELEVDSFPSKTWRTYIADMLDEPYGDKVHKYQGVKGNEQLREELRRYLYRSRGVNCDAEQIIMCSGTQGALEIIIKLFPGEKTVAMEEPSYDGASAVFHSNNFKILPVPVTKTGIDLKALSNLSAPMVHIAPSHQFPTGAVMPIQNRIEIINLASERDMIIIEDDYDSEFRYKGQPIPSLQSIDKSERVIYIGTFSKVLSAGLRMAYLVLPKRLLSVYDEKYKGYHCTVSSLEQQVLTKFISDGHWDRQIRRICLSHKKKHDVLISSIKEKMGKHVNIYGHQAGLHILLEFPEGQQEDILIKKALEQGVKVCSASPFWLNKESYKGNTLILGYGKMKEQDIPIAVSLLYKAWFE